MTSWIEVASVGSLRLSLDPTNTQRALLESGGKSREVVDFLAIRDFYREYERALDRREVLLPALPAPQLYEDAVNPLRLLMDDDWWAQPKYNGVRLRLHIANGTATGVTRSDRYRELPDTLRAKCMGVRNTLILDGELVGEEFTPFDLLQQGDAMFTLLPYHKRLAKLDPVCGDLGFTPARLAKTPGEKHELLEYVLKSNGEGLMFKAKNAKYIRGRSDVAGRKWKFTQTCTCVVLGENDDTRSVRIGLRRTDNSLQEVGDVGIPPNWDVPPAGALIEVRYLYASSSHRLVQPVYLGPREDAVVSDMVATLKVGGAV